MSLQHRIIWKILSYPGSSISPWKNKHSQFSDLIQKINEAKEELEDTFRHNDEMREQEHVYMAQNTIVISSDSSSSDYLLEIYSDESSDSVTRKIPTKPVTSSNKSSTSPAEKNPDNEETPLKQPHQDLFT